MDSIATTLTPWPRVTSLGRELIGVLGPDRLTVRPRAPGIVLDVARRIRPTGRRLDRSVRQSHHPLVAQSHLPLEKSMSYLQAIERLVNEHRADIEADLAEARLSLERVISELVEAERSVKTFEALLGLSPATLHETTVPEGRTTLHEAMRQVLQSAPNRRMPAGDLAATINRRGLYRMRDGRPVEPQQIHARVGHYGHMFERDGRGIGLI